MTVASLLGILTFCAGPPCVAAILFFYPHRWRFMLGLMAFTTCHVKKPFYQEVFFEAYRGVDRGFGVTLTDLLLFGFLIWIIGTRNQRKIVWWPVSTTIWWLLIGVSLISLVGCPVAWYGLFTVHKFIRGYLLFWVTINLVQNRDDVQTIVFGLMTAVLFQTGITIWDKYVTGSVVNRSVGTMPHPNSLAMYIDLILPMVLAIFLSDGFPVKMNKLVVVCVFGGMIAVIFTKSRASLAIMSAAIAGTTVLSLILRPTTRKMSIILTGFILIDIIAILAAPKMIARFQRAPLASEMTRHYFNDAAKQMARDYLFGTGINSYSWMLGLTRYYRLVYPDYLEEEEVELEDFQETTMGQSRLGTAHHIYYLFAAETGWPGLIVFLLLIGRLLWWNVILLWRRRDEYEQAVVLGLLIGFTTLHVQGVLEWAFRQTQIFFLFCLLSGLMVAMDTLQSPRSASPEPLAVTKTDDGLELVTLSDN